MCVAIGPWDLLWRLIHGGTARGRQIAAGGRDIFALRPQRAPQGSWPAPGFQPSLCMPILVKVSWRLHCSASHPSKNSLAGVVLPCWRGGSASYLSSVRPRAETRIPSGVMWSHPTGARITSTREALRMEVRAAARASAQTHGRVRASADDPAPCCPPDDAAPRSKEAAPSGHVHSLRSDSPSWWRS